MKRKMLTKENNEFLATIESDQVRAGFHLAMISSGKEDDIKAIADQLPSLSDLWSQDLVNYIKRKEMYNDGDYDECNDGEIWFGAYMWYLCLDERGFYWCGNPLYGESDWDNADVIRVSVSEFDDKEKVAKKLLKGFVNAGNVRDRWVESSI